MRSTLQLNDTKKEPGVKTFATRADAIAAHPYRPIVAVKVLPLNSNIDLERSVLFMFFIVLAFNDCHRKLYLISIHFSAISILMILSYHRREGTFKYSTTATENDSVPIFCRKMLSSGAGYAVKMLQRQRPRRLHHLAATMVQTTQTTTTVMGSAARAITTIMSIITLKQHTTRS